MGARSVIMPVPVMAALALGQYQMEHDVLTWAQREAPLLTDHVQLTFRDRFDRAGEAYFSPDARWIIFQAVPAPPPGEAPGDHYSMYVAEVQWRDGTIVGLGEPICISEAGSANTCGWFHPTEPGRVLFGSTIVPPRPGDKPGFNRGRYVWAFHTEMEVVERRVAEIAPPPPVDVTPQSLRSTIRPYVVAEPVFRRPGYDAEASWSADGRYILYTRVDEEKNPHRLDADIWLYDLVRGTHTPLVVEPGYDGGPFFSPDGTMICFRADRDMENLLQIYVSRLAFDEDGTITGIASEHKLTQNLAVNWGPFWHPSGAFLVYASSELGHTNYEVFAIEVDLTARPGTARTRRITYADRADVLPVFSPDGSWLLWTSQRGQPAPGQERSSSQLWAARWHMPPSTDALFRVISRDEAIAIALAHVRDVDGWVGDLETSATQHPHEWMVTVRTRPKTVDGWRKVVIANDGRVLGRVVPGPEHAEQATPGRGP